MGAWVENRGWNWKAGDLGFLVEQRKPGEAPIFRLYSRPAHRGTEPKLFGFWSAADCDYCAHGVGIVTNYSPDYTRVEIETAEAQLAAAYLKQRGYPELVPLLAAAGV